MNSLQTLCRLVSRKLFYVMLFALSAGCTSIGSGRNMEVALPANKTGGRTDLTPENPDTIRIINLPGNRVVCAGGREKVKTNMAPFSTNVAVDSICWQMVYASPGITMEPFRGREGGGVITFFRQNSHFTGEIVLEVTPFKSPLVMKPRQVKFILENCPEKNGPGDRIAGASYHLQGITHCNQKDTGLVNRQRRKNITEFSDLLYMYSSTSSSREKDFFRNAAENRLKLFPKKTLDLLPGFDSSDIFNDPALANPIALPLYDTRRCYIIGIRVVKK